MAKRSTVYDRFRPKKVSWRQFVWLIAGGLVLFAVAGLLGWRISAATDRVRAAGNLVDGTIVDVRDRRAMDLLDVKYRGGGGLERKAEVVVWDSYGYEAGDAVKVYVDPEDARVAVLADSFSMTSYWSAYLAIDLAMAGGLLILVAVGRTVWDRFGQ